MRLAVEDPHPLRSPTDGAWTIVRRPHEQLENPGGFRDANKKRLTAAASPARGLISLVTFAYPLEFRVSLCKIAGCQQVVFVELINSNLGASASELLSFEPGK